MPQTEEPEDPELSAWREIVENYGDRAELDDDGDARAQDPGQGPGQDPGQEPQSGPSYALRFGEFDDDVDEPFEPAVDEGGFEPPEPEPLHLGPARTAAWVGVLGAPLAALVATVVVTATGITVAPWFGGVLVAAFLGGFGYLVLTMPRDRDDPWDDGARL